MKTRILLVICCVLVSQSCTKTVGVLEENSVNTEYSIITIEQALNNLSRFLSEVDMNQTREGEYRKIKTIDTYSDQLSTRSEENLPQAYIVNYENDGGFAILGANTGVFPIIAVTDNGQIDPETLLVEDESGIVDKEFLAAYLKGSIQYIDDPEDTVAIEGTRSRANVSPLLNHNYEFSQTHSYCHKSNGEFAICGCAATAIAIIVSYNGKPYMNVTTEQGGEQINYPGVDSLNGTGHCFSFYNGTDKKATININPDDYYSIYNYRHNTNNVDSLISGTPLADLIDEYPLYVYSGKHSFYNSNVSFYRTRSLLQAAIFYRLNTSPGFESTGASANDIMDCLEGINYQNVSKRNAYSITNNMLNDIEDMLTDGKPVIMGGRPLLGSGHVWVVDGEYQLPVYNTFALHFNWGWGGRCNGYFAPSSSLNSGAPVIYDYNDSSFNNVSENFGHFTTIRYDLPSYTYTFSNALSVHYHSYFSPLN